MPVAIHLRKLGKRFGELKAVDGLDLDIHSDRITGLLGPNGAGKSTTIHMVCGLLKPSSGAIEFRQYGNRQAARIGYCPQENIYYPKLTCTEQLRFYASMHGVKSQMARQRSRELLTMLGLEAKSDVLASKLSGGMKRRLNIALALVHDPRVLILDEPEAGLDPQSRVLVREVIREYSKGRTVILSTHNMDEAERLADTVAIIDRGRLLVVDSPERLRKSIGEGDILEFMLDTRPEELEAGLAMDPYFGGNDIKVMAGSRSVIFHGRDLASRLAAISTRLEASGLHIKEVRLRQNTLEDVFIHLTGRELRS